MTKLTDIQAEVTALVDVLGALEKDHKDAALSDSFYYKKRQALVRDQQITLNQLKGILEDNGAPELSPVIDKLSSSAKDEEIEEELEKAQEAGEEKGWGAVLKESISEKKGSIVQLALSGALKVAQFLI